MRASSTCRIGCTVRTLNWVPPGVSAPSVKKLSTVAKHNPVLPARGSRLLPRRTRWRSRRSPRGDSQSFAQRIPQGPGRLLRLLGMHQRFPGGGRALRHRQCVAQVARTRHSCGDRCRSRSTMMCGLLVEGFDMPNSIMMPHNPPALSHADGDGRIHVKANADLIALQGGSAGGAGANPPERTGACRARSPEETLWHHDPAAQHEEMFAEEVELVKKLYNAGWEDNLGIYLYYDRRGNRRAGGGVHARWSSRNWFPSSKRMA